MDPHVLTGGAIEVGCDVCQVAKTLTVQSLNVETTYWDRNTTTLEWCHGCSDADAIPVCCDEERAEIKSEIKKLPFLTLIYCMVTSSE